MQNPNGVPGEVVTAAIEAWRQRDARHWVAVEGDSMWPILRAGDRVRVAHGGPAPRPGDIVVFRAGGQLVVHRLVGSRVADGTTLYITRGDHCPAIDPPVSAGDLLGRAVEAVSTRGTMPLDTRLARAIGRMLVAGRVRRPHPASGAGALGGARLWCTRLARRGGAWLRRAARRLLGWQGRLRARRSHGVPPQPPST
ncbi:MAG: hypothetical protein GX557_04135 [Chloroflexi bacterium]|nr:hypothetical protein [Chloroflexota bacterium]